MTVKNVRVCDACDQRGENSLSLSSGTESFHVDQHGYTLDLCDQHKLEFKALWAQVVAWKEMATVITGTTQPRNGRSADWQRRQENREVREWALAKGIPIGDRGRISDELREQFRQETQTAPFPPVAPVIGGEHGLPSMVPSE